MDDQKKMLESCRLALNVLVTYKSKIIKFKFKNTADHKKIRDLLWCDYVLSEFICCGEDKTTPTVIKALEVWENDVLPWVKLKVITLDFLSMVRPIIEKNEEKSKPGVKINNS